MAITYNSELVEGFSVETVATDGNWQNFPLKQQIDLH
jgi:hypothetical protein